MNRTSFSFVRRFAAAYWSRPAIWPALWPMVVDYVRRRVRPSEVRSKVLRLAQEREEAERWCRENAVEMDGLPRSLGIASPFVPLKFAEEAPEEVLRHAEERVRSCPFKLGGAGNLDLLYSLARAGGNRRIVETGVAYGWSSLALLLATEDVPGAVVYSVDLPHLSLRNDEWVGIAVPASLRVRWRLYRTTDRLGLPWALRRAKSVDLAHYDSDKSAEGRAFGYAAIWRRLREGGVLVSDDVGDNLEFRRFAERVGRTPVVVAWGGKHQGVLVR